MCCVGIYMCVSVSMCLCLCMQLHTWAHTHEDPNLMSGIFSLIPHLIFWPMVSQPYLKHAIWVLLTSHLCGESPDFSLHYATLTNITWFWDLRSRPLSCKWSALTTESTSAMFVFYTHCLFVYLFHCSLSSAMKVTVFDFFHRYLSSKYYNHVWLTVDNSLNTSGINLVKKNQIKKNMLFKDSMHFTQ